MREQRRLHTGWTVRRKQNRFLELRGAAEPPVPVTLPHDVSIGEVRDPDGEHAVAYARPGVWEYAATLAVPAEWADRRVSLRFEGVYRDAKVSVNGTVAVVHEYGYGEFILELDQFLRYGADNELKVECRTHTDARWYTGAGIHRPLTLTVTDLVHVAHHGVTITTPEIDQHGAVVAIATVVNNSTSRTRTARVTHDLISADGVVVASGTAPLTLRPNSSATCRQRIYVAHALRWDDQQPNLYTCRSTVTDGDMVDEVSESFGVRSLTVDPVHGLRVNGRSVKLRGACVHHDNGPLGAATIDRAEERRVELLKAAGFNAIRSAHNPISRAMLDACDRLGMYVMDEAFDVWLEAKADHDYSLRFSSTWRSEIAAMVHKDKNRPSVIMYSTGNEIPDVGTPLGAALARDLAEYTRSLDPTRLITNALQPLLSIQGIIPQLAAAAAAAEAENTSPDLDNADNMGVNTMMVKWERLKRTILKGEVVSNVLEETSSSLDVVGYNYLDERYAQDREMYPNRVIVGSETYAHAIGRCWPMIEASSHLIGDFTWTGWDYLGEVGIGRVDYDTDGAAPSMMGEYPWLLAATGDIDVLGGRRPQSYYREIVFGLRSAPYIAVHRPEHYSSQVGFSGPWSWSDALGSWSWPGHENAPVRIDVYSASDEVELLVNGQSVGRQPTGEAHNFRTLFDTVYTPGDIVAIGYTAGVEDGRHTLRSAEGPTVLRAVVDRDRIAASEGDLAYIDIALVDSNGTVQNAVTATVKVDIQGPGVLQGLASADPRSTDLYTGTSCATFDGAALAVVRPTGAGTITVTVTADACLPVTVSIEAEAP